MKHAAVLQARAGSRRLPGKMLMPFHRNKSIPELIIRQLKTVLAPGQIILATTRRPEDNALVQIAEKSKVHHFRGDATDVLKRFLDAAEQFQLDCIIRICADNPFLRMDAITLLIDEFNRGDSEYISFGFPDGTPAMKSHIGLFAEIVSVACLKRIASSTADPLYREHVTNYVYDHKSEIRSKFLSVPDSVANRTDIRLTIDTKEDFENLAELYARVAADSEPGLCDLLRAIDQTPDLLRSMKLEIDRNNK